MSLLNHLLNSVERGRVPDWIVRKGIRRLCRRRLKQLPVQNCELAQQTLSEFLEESRQSPIAPVPEKANEQHYELPAEFFSLVLGAKHKYSCCYWHEDTTSLEKAEEISLEITCHHADLQEGQKILELGCGWGSLSLWMAEHFPLSQIVAVSNSNPQREFIESRAKARRLDNLKVITADMNDFQIDDQFDRVVSVEMFEHMRNHAELLHRIGTWLKPGGKLFAHHFCHREHAYRFETESESDWMGRYFFTGGIMPADDYLLHFQQDLKVTNRWRWNGRHYQKTSEAWLHNLDAHREQILPILESTYPPEEAIRWLHRWRLFFLAVAELFGMNQGQEWWVIHTLMQKPTNG